jgi:RNA polymerase sigma-70 factor (ECF subfamily)
MKRDIEIIISEYGNSLFKICFGYGKSKEEAEDLLQEVYINIWRGLPTFRKESSLKTWVYRIAINTCLLSTRKKKIQTSCLHESVLSYSAESNPESDYFEELHEAINQLKEPEKSIILLYLDGFSHKEISDVIGISSNYVGVKINRTKTIISKKLNIHEQSKKHLAPNPKQTTK